MHKTQKNTAKLELAISNVNKSHYNETAQLQDFHTLLKIKTSTNMTRTHCQQCT